MLRHAHRPAGLVASVLALALAACPSDRDGGPPPPASAARRVIGVSLLTQTHLFYRDLEAGLRQTAERLHVDLKVVSSEFDAATQISQLENFVTQKVDAIVVCPADPKGVVGAIRRANEAKIPVFTTDAKAEGGDVVCAIASDNLQGGRLIGEYLAKALGGKGEVAVIDYPISLDVQDLVKGFEAALAASPEIRIVAKQPGGAVRDQAATAMENVLQAHPGVTGVFGINDDSALGAIAALDARGRSDIRVVGFDADAGGREAIRKGRLLADAGQDPREIGRVTIETVVAHLEGKPVPKTIAIPTRIVDKAGLEKEK